MGSERAAKKFTPGPWQWTYSGRSYYLRTVGRGLLTVMDFTRMGMSSAQPRFAKWEGEDRNRIGGIMFKAQELGELHDHPDARLIALSPDLVEALRGTVQALENCSRHNGLLAEEIAKLDRARALLALVDGKAGL